MNTQELEYQYAVQLCFAQLLGALYLENNP